MSDEDSSSTAHFQVCTYPVQIIYIHPGTRGTRDFGTSTVSASMVPSDLETETQYIIQEHIFIMHNLWRDKKKS